MQSIQLSLKLCILHPSFGLLCLVPGVMGRRSTFSSSEGCAGSKVVWMKPKTKLRVGGEQDELVNAF